MQNCIKPVPVYRSMFCTVFMPFVSSWASMPYEVCNKPHKLLYLFQRTKRLPLLCCINPYLVNMSAFYICSIYSNALRARFFMEAIDSYPESAVAQW